MTRSEYIASGADTVAGWFRPADRILFDAIDSAQRESGITGDLLEIGCYQGTSAILLGYMRQENERLVICDLFDGPTESPEDDAERARYYTPSFNRQTFESNYRQFHDELPDIIAEPSSVLRNHRLKRTFRFIHVDGSHAYDQVKADLLLARSLLIPEGVVVFDDLLSPHTPGVTAACWEGVINHQMIPLAQTVKMYATWGTGTVPRVLPSYEHSVFGHTMIHCEG